VPVGDALITPFELQPEPQSPPPLPPSAPRFRCGPRGAAARRRPPSRLPSFALPGPSLPVRPSGDDGTRTHDPLLANTPDLDDGERWRTPLADQRRFVDGGGRQRTVADVLQMFDQNRLLPRSARQGSQDGRTTSAPPLLIPPVSFGSRSSNSCALTGRPSSKLAAPTHTRSQRRRHSAVRDGPT
jgi:hypothetical protein